jgi:hypothetical protein
MLRIFQFILLIIIHSIWKVFLSQIHWIFLTFGWNFQENFSSVENGDSSSFLLNFSFLCFYYWASNFYLPFFHCMHGCWYYWTIPMENGNENFDRTISVGKMMKNKDNGKIQISFSNTRAKERILLLLFRTYFSFPFFHNMRISNWLTSWVQGLTVQSKMLLFFT